MAITVSDLRSPMSASQFAAEYRDVPPGHIATGDSLIREMCRWVVDGFHHRHEFRLVATATATSWGIQHQNHIHHVIDGKAVEEPFRWGHDSVKAYMSSREREWRRENEWYVGLIAANVMRYDLPCCGGRFVFENEYTDYSTLVIGRCADCCASWEVVDGGFWSRRHR